MVDYENLGMAILLIYDHLKNDKQSIEIINILNSSSNDDEIMRTIKLAINRLIELNKNDVVQQIKELIK